MDPPHLLNELLDDGVDLRVVAGRLRVEFPSGTRTLDRAEAIRSERDRLIDLASRSAAEILTTLRRAGGIIVLHENHILIEGDRAVLTAEHRALIRLHRDELVDELRRELASDALVVGSVWTISPEILELGPVELDAYHLELLNCPDDDPATPEEWAALSHARRTQDPNTTDIWAQELDQRGSLSDARIFLDVMGRDVREYSATAVAP